jgi:PKD repeat protein
MWVWKVDDLVFGRHKNAATVFNTAGNYKVSLTYVSGATEKVATRTITVVEGLRAAFTYAPAVVDSDTVVAFTDVSVGNPTSWSWAFGDGTTSTAQNPTHQFAAGSFIVTLTVGNGKTTNSTSATLAVSPALTCWFSWTPDPAVQGEPVQFKDESIAAVRWLWNFGDGTTSTLRNPEHVFNTAGTFTITLTVWDTVGNSKSMSTMWMVPSPGATD